MPVLAKVLSKCSVQKEVVRIIMNIHERIKCAVKTRAGLSEQLEVATGVRQGCVLSPVLFNIYMDNIIRQCLEKGSGGVKFAYRLDGKMYIGYRDRSREAHGSWIC